MHNIFPFLTLNKKATDVNFTWIYKHVKFNIGNEDLVLIS
jgi:hypothetical protein